MIKGAIFDMDGVLLNSMPMWDHAGELYLKGIGITARPGLEKELFTMTMEKGTEYIKKEYQLSLSVLQIMAGINQTISNFYQYHALLKPGVAELLKHMKKNHIPMTVASSTDRCHIEAALERLQVLDLFDRIFTCTETGVGKVKPDIYIEAAAFMGTDREATWVFEDAYHAAETAYKAGFKVCGVYDLSSDDRQDILKTYSHIYIDSFDNRDIKLLKDMEEFQ